MKMLKNLISMAALAALLGCENQDGKTGNIVSSATDKNLTVQSQSDDSQVTNTDSKAVMPPYQLVTHEATNQQPEEIWTSDGYGFDDISLTNFSVGEGTNSLP